MSPLALGLAVALALLTAGDRRGRRASSRRRGGDRARRGAARASAHPRADRDILTEAQRRTYHEIRWAAPKNH